MHEAGYRVLNKVHCLKTSDPSEKTRMLAAFAERFSALRRQGETLPVFFAHAGLADIDIQRIKAVARDQGKFPP